MEKFKPNTWYIVQDVDSKHHGKLIMFEKSLGAFHVFEDQDGRELPIFNSSLPNMVEAGKDEGIKLEILKRIKLTEGYDWPLDVKQAAIAYEESRVGKSGDRMLLQAMRNSWKKYQRDDQGNFKKDQSGNYLLEQTDGFQPMNIQAETLIQIISPEGIEAIKETVKAASTDFQPMKPPTTSFGKLTLSEGSIKPNPYQIGDPVIISSTHHQYAGRTGKVKKLCSNVFPERIYVELDLNPREKVAKIAMVETRMIKLTGIQSFQNLTPQTMTKDTSTAVSEQSGSGYTMMKIKLTLIAESALNPRKHFDDHAVNELAASIKEKGVLQPILVRPIMDSLPQTYEIVCGARRYRASKLAEMKYIPAVVRDISDDEALEMMIVENLQRKDVNPMEEAAAIQSMVKHYKSYTEVALRLGKSARFVAERDKLNQLIESFQSLVFSGEIPLKLGYALAALTQEVQQNIFGETCHINNGKPEIKGHSSVDSIYRYTKKSVQNLSEATFDTDRALSEDVPACSVCVHNSANQPVLFGDDTPKCLNSVCFESKTKLVFRLNLHSAIDDGILIVQTAWGTLDNKETIKILKDAGVKCLNRDNFEIVKQPTPPSPPQTLEEIKAEFMEENEYQSESDLNQGHLDYIASEYEIAQNDYQEAVESYQEELAAFENKTGFFKAFVVEGYSDVGKRILIKLRGSAAEKKAITSTIGNPEAAELKDQRAKMIIRNMRNKELDREKIYAQATPLLGPDWTMDATDLNHIEKVAAIIALSHQFYMLRDRLKDILGLKDWDYGLMNLYNALTKAPEKVDQVLNLCLRFTIPNCLIDATTLDYEKSGRPRIMMDLIRSRKEKELTEIELNQAGIANVREEKYQKKLEKLNSDIEAIEKGGKHE